MARIRTIKPDFWDSPATGQASLRARLLFIAMWNWADDFGIGDAHAGRLWNFAFPNDRVNPADIPAVYAEVSNLFGVIFYEHEGRPYYYIPSWNKHQKIDRRSVQKVPYPDESAPALFPAIPGPPNPADIPPKSQRNQPVGTEELGTEELYMRTEGAPYSKQFEEWWKHWPVKRDKKRAYPAFEKALKRAKLADLIAGAVAYGKYLKAHPEQSPKFAEGWLNDDRWNDDLGSNAGATPSEDRIKSWRSRNGQPPVPADLLNTDPAAANAWGRAFLAAIGDGKTDQQATQHANTQIGR